MGVKYLKDGQGFSAEHFPADFGFHGSNHGRHDSHPHISHDDDDFGDGSYVAKKARGGAIKRKYDIGGPVTGQTSPQAQMMQRPGMAPPQGQMPQGMPQQGQMPPQGQMGYPPQGMPQQGMQRPMGAPPSGGSTPGGWRPPQMGGAPQGGMPQRAMIPQGTPAGVVMNGAMPAGGQQRPQGAPMARGGHVNHYDMGGAVGAPPSSGGAAAGGMGALNNAQVTMSAGDMKNAAQSLINIGRQQGAAAAMRAGHQAGQLPQHAPVGNAAMHRPIGGQPGASQPTLAEGGHFIGDAVQHPGRMQRGAHREGVSTHQYMQEHAHDPGSMGSAARLGLRLTGGDLAPHRGKRKG